MASLVDRSARQIQSYENDKAEPPAPVLLAWARAVGKKLDYFLDDDEPPLPLPHSRPVDEFVLLPVLGRVTAGGGGVAEESIEGYRHLPVTFIPTGQEKACFLVEARGESMTDVGISPGDLLLVCSAVEVRDGDVAVVDVDGEAVVKRVYRQEGRLLLTSENPAFVPFTVNRARIVGRVMKIIRDL